MKFEEIYIDGFGIFHDYHIKNLTPGLTIFVGPNEAGKSTILSFQNRILFGFPDKRSKLNLYPPLSGGNHGGRLIVSSSDNTRYTIERYASANDAKVVLPDGSTAGATEISKLIGHANKDIFENIYAFGLAELQDFETLNSEAVKGRLYSAGTGIGAVSLSEVQSSLEKDASALFRPRGKTQEINVLFGELKRIDSKLREIEEDAQNFDTLHKEFEEQTKKIDELEQNRNQLRIKLNHTTNLITVWDDWRKIQDANERLKEIPGIEKFPKNGLGLLDGHQEKMNDLTDSISRNNEKLEKIKNHKFILKIDENLVKYKDKILELQKGQDKYISAVRDLPKLKDNLKRENEDLKELLKEMGPDWDEGKLSTFDISIPTKEQVRKQHQALEEIVQSIRDVEKESQNIAQNIGEIEDEKKKVEERLNELSIQQIEDKNLIEQKKALQRLRIRYPSVKEKEAEIRSLERTGDLIALLKPQPVRALPKLPSWPALMFIVAGIASLILSIIGNNWILGIGILAILSIFATTYVILSRKKVLVAEPEEKEAEDLTERSKELSMQRNQLESELKEVKNEILSDAQVCGFESIPDPQLVENKDAELQKASEGQLQINQLTTQKASLEQKSEKLTNEKIAVTENLEGFKKEKEIVQTEWKRWLTDRGLHSELTPQGAIDSFAAIKTCKEKERSINTIKERINDITGFIEEYESKLFSVLQNCNRKSEGINVVVELEKVTKDLNQSLEDMKTLERLNLDEKNLNIEKHELEEKLKKAQNEVNELLSLGSAESEVEFRENAKNWEERNNLKEEILQGEHQIKRISGEGFYSKFINELRDTSLETLKGEESELNERIKAIENNLSELREQRGGVAKEIEQIEKGEEGSALRMEKATNIQKLSEKANEWSVLTLAKTILEKAIKRYERERQPGVIREAQSFFTKMTLGRYSQIFAPLDEAKIYVVDRDGRQKEIQDLSRGTAEQLYLSLRFGFIREFSKRAESLPIVFDDILVNFDPDRFRAACEAIKELTKTNQILYFTCHPESANLLTKIMPDSKIIYL